MRRTILLLTVMATTVLLTTGVALASHPAAQNFIFGTSGDDVLSGTAQADDIYGYEGNDNLSGLEGDDYVDGGIGADTLYGGDGNDIVYDNYGNNTSYGGAGDDHIHAGAGLILNGQYEEFTEYVYAEAGNDTVFARDNQKDFVNCGSDRNDTVYYDRGLDRLRGCENKQTPQ